MHGQRPARYLQTCWLPGRRVASPSPNTVNSHLGLLSGLFSRLGRRAQYDSETGLGNPCSSQPLTAYKAGYTRGAIDEGYEERAAVSLSPDAFALLMNHLWAYFRLYDGS
jgi:hypothetical protein